MRGNTRLGTVLMAGVLSFVMTTAPLAATPCERRQVWDREFAYIDKISTTCRILTTGALIGVGLYAPYPSLVAELGGSAATVAKYAAAFGVDLDRVGFDKHHICRLVRAGRALHEQKHSGVRRRLLQYGLCRPTDQRCKTRVKAEILRLYDLPAQCPQA